MLNKHLYKFLFLLFVFAFFTKGFCQNENEFQRIRSSYIFKDKMNLQKNEFFYQINSPQRCDLDVSNIDNINVRLINLDNVEENSNKIIYDKQKKDPAVAVFLSFLVSSTGHLYAGNWPRGLVFTLARIGWAILVSQNKDPYGNYVIAGGLLYLSIPEMVDAANEAKRYNNKLWKKINNESTTFKIKILPSNRAVMLGFSRNF